MKLQNLSGKGIALLLFFAIPLFWYIYTYLQIQSDLHMDNPTFWANIWKIPFGIGSLFLIVYLYRLLIKKTSKVKRIISIVVFPLWFLSIPIPIVWNWVYKYYSNLCLFYKISNTSVLALREQSRLPLPLLTSARKMPPDSFWHPPKPFIRG